MTPKSCVHTHILRWKISATSGEWWGTNISPKQDPRLSNWPYHPECRWLPLSTGQSLPIGKRQEGRRPWTRVLQSPVRAKGQGPLTSQKAASILYFLIKEHWHSGMICAQTTLSLSRPLSGVSNPVTLTWSINSCIHSCPGMHAAHRMHGKHTCAYI